MKDRQFMIVLALVVAAGLVMGLVAFRITGSAASPTAATTNTARNDGTRVSAGDEQQAVGAPASTDSAGSQDSTQPAMKDGQSPDISTPEPAPPPPPEAPPATVTTETSQ